MARDSRWLIIFVIILSVIITASLMNANHEIDTTTRIENTINVDDSDLSINWDRYPITGVTLKNSIELKDSGTYRISGVMYDGTITINSGQNGVVRLILDNVIMKSSNGPAIACLSGDDLVIELVGNNIISDGTTYADTYDEDVTGSIYSKADLTFQGNGTLSLTGNFQDGIVAKDDLTFRSGTYDITAQDDGIRGKDSVHVASGNFTINATADAIKTTNENDQGKGFILVEGGNFDLTAGAKGVKSTKSILIHDGKFTINTTDDSIHSDNYVSIDGGEINISAGDDGIHANRELGISGGNISITKSYEGLEAKKVTVSGGNISVKSFDDGINAGGGADSSAMNRPGQSPFDADEDCVLTIDGGDLYINAAGDGIDSNGWIYINDGKVVVDGPTDDGNGALDAGMGIVMKGGEVMALGSSGMAETLGQTSTVNNISIYLNKTQPTGTKVEIRDQDDNIIMSHTSAKTFNHLAVGSPSFILGQQYSLYLDDELYANISISGTVTTFGNNSRYTPPSADTRR